MTRLSLPAFLSPSLMQAAIRPPITDGESVITSDTYSRESFPTVLRYPVRALQLASTAHSVPLMTIVSILNYFREVAAAELEGIGAVLLRIGRRRFGVACDDGGAGIVDSVAAFIVCTRFPKAVTVGRTILTNVL